MALALSLSLKTLCGWGGDLLGNVLGVLLPPQHSQNELALAWHLYSLSQGLLHVLRLLPSSCPPC